MMRVLDNDQFIVFSNILWCVWKARNEFIFKGKNTTPQAILAQATAMGIAKPMRQLSHKQDGLEVIPVPSGAGVILIDASWDCSKKTGTAFIVFNGKGELIFVQTRSTLCTDPLQAEAMALLHVLQYIKGEGGTQPVSNFLVCTDCKTFMKAITQNDYQELPSWQAAEVVAQGAQLYQQMMENITFRHIVSRKMLPQLHLLANWARTSCTSYTGMVPANVAEKANLHPQLSSEFFRLSD